MTHVLRRYTFKLYPTRAQTETLQHQRVLHAHLYNALLQQRIEAYQRQRRTLTYYDQCKEITALRADDADYRALSRASMDATAQRLDRAFQSFFRRAKAGAGAQSGFPRFRASALYPSIPFKAERTGWSLDLRPGRAGGHLLRVQGVPGRLRLRGRLPAPVVELRSCEIMWREDVWWLSLVTAMEPRRIAGRNTGEVVFDLAEACAIVRMVDGERLAGREDPQGDERRISLTVQGDTDGRVSSPCGCGDATGGGKGVDRCKRGSNRYRRRRLRAARQAARAARQRREAMHVWTTAVARDLRSARIVKPPIQVATRSGRGSEKSPGAMVALKAQINRAVLDQGAAAAVAALAYKIEEAGGTADVVIDQAAPILSANALVDAAKTVRRAKRVSASRGAKRATSARPRHPSGEGANDPTTEGGCAEPVVASPRSEGRDGVRYGHGSSSSAGATPRSDGRDGVRNTAAAVMFVVASPRSEGHDGGRELHAPSRQLTTVKSKTKDW